MNNKEDNHEITVTIELDGELTDCWTYYDRPEKFFDKLVHKLERILDKKRDE